MDRLVTRKGEGQTHLHPIWRGRMRKTVVRKEERSQTNEAHVDQAEHGKFPYPSAEPAQSPRKDFFLIAGSGGAKS